MTITAVARGDGVMPSGQGEQYDFFLSRRGSVAVIAREVHDVLTERGYKVLLQDCDIPFGASFIEAMHEAVKNSRDHHPAHARLRAVNRRMQSSLPRSMGDRWESNERLKFIIALVTGPRMADLLVTHELGGFGGYDEIAAFRAG
jgi:hypothetical protein